MINALTRFWQQWLTNPRSMYILVCVKTIIVLIVLLFTWALQGKDSAPVYMRF